ncbi:MULTISPECIES: universal stress protein [Maribacter]|uniref:Universal stress protein n=2 Tax=Maribacter TaxID=252356 RepID=A0A5B2TQS2_9FLAO|nr:MULTISPECIES: universal stress protein [Maribacter]KAA2216654.1 universal stress protein [Maribacter flavus]MDC6406232.1 universal stress protein [Maribacter sp. PR66]MEE1973352.1 universal stress protein [Maribacter flavus]TLF44406.1 universal stress protein [Maribacter aurantiacus]
MTILYATDCNENSVSALRYAQKLSLQLNAQLVLLYVYDIPPVAGRTIKTEEQLQRSLKGEKLELLTRYYRENGIKDQQKLSIHFWAEYGISIADTILEYALTLNCELVLVGMKDEHTKRGMFSGNIANKLLKNVNCKLLIVPNTFEYSTITSIAYATDFENADVRAISELKQLFPHKEVTVKIVHVTTDENTKEGEQMEWFKEILLEKIPGESISFHLINAQTVPLGLRMFIGDENSSMIALLEREEQSVFKRLFHKDLIKSMESQIKIPILSINPKSLN